MPDARQAEAGLAALLLEQRERGTPVALPAARPADMTAAYRIQDASAALLAARGWRAIGYKVAGTNPVARAQLCIAEPFHGRLYDRLAQPSPARLAARPGFHRVHEAEIAIRLGRDLDPAGAPFGAAALRAATDAVLPAIELIGTVFTPWTEAGAPLLAADNAAFGHWVFGAPAADWRDLDLMELEARLLIDGVVAASGKGRNVDGGAFGAAAWLATTLAAAGRGLRAGDLVTTGSVTPPVPVRAGQSVRAEFGPLGAVDLTMD